MLDATGSFRLPRYFVQVPQHTAARLYAFCRWVDDAVDEAESPERARTAISSFVPSSIKPFARSVFKTI